MTKLIKNGWLAVPMFRRGLSAVVCFLGLSLLAAWAADNDNDGMDDSFETFFGLSTTTNDAALDPDDDTLSNIDESALWTDPLWPDTDRDEFADGSDSNPVSRAYIPWGNPFFSGTNSDVFYTWPNWMVSAFKNGGDWETNPPGWHVTAAVTNPASLAIELDRAYLTNDLRLKVGLAAGSEASLFLDLVDTNGLVIVTNALDNLLSGVGTSTVRIFSIPLETNASASGLWLRHGTGDVTVSESLLYIDLDGDGLDADQERQLGTSDVAFDTDGDGFSDAVEVQIGTDPLNAGSHPPTVPEVSNAFGASNVRYTVARLQGAVSSTGSAPTSVFCHWGPADGFTNVVAWSNAVNLGVRPEGSVSCIATGLLPNTLYRYRYSATNAAGQGWASTSASFTTSGSVHRMSIFLGGYTRVEPLTNFPLMVVFSNNLAGSGFAYNQVVSPNGYDLRFKSADETSNLNYQIEQWDTNGLSVVWVQVPLLTSNASILAFWGDSGLASTPAACTTNGATWDSSFKAVWHLGETVTDEAVGGTNHLDSTTNRYSGIQAGNDDVTGQIGKAQEFDGTGTADYLTFPGVTWTPTRFSVSFWIRPDTTLNYNQALGATAAWNCFHLHTTSSGQLYAGITATDSTGRFTPTSLPAGTMVTGVWQHFTFTFDNGAASMYKNGTKLASKTLSMPAAWTGGFRLNSSLDGKVDELRIDAAARSSNWVWACWMNQASNAVFSSFGTAQYVVQEYAPTLASAAAATPSTVSGTTSLLTVLGADDGGEDTLVYTWATNGVVPDSVMYSVNGNNAAKETTVTFTEAGVYGFKATILNWIGLTTSSVVGVTVNQTLASLSVSPQSCVVTNIYSQQFIASGLDQFGHPMTVNPEWSVNGGGVMDANGRFTAASTGGTYAVSAECGGVYATACVVVVSADTWPDADSDGLADAVESGTGVYLGLLDTGTSSTNWDSDLDGLGDGAEVKIWHTDPHNSDTNPPTVWITLPSNNSEKVWVP